MTHTVTNSSELAAALAAAVEGDTIELAPGSYEGSFTVAHSNLTLVGAGTEQTRLHGQVVQADGVRGLLLQDLSYDANAFSLHADASDVAWAGPGSPGWQTDRAALASLAVVADPVDPGNDVLAFTTNGTGESSGFRAYQGAKYLPGSGERWDVALGNGAAVEARFYVDPEFANDDGKVQSSGLWVQLQNADNSIGGGGWFAILEYVDADGAATLGATATDDTAFTGGFRIWLDPGPNEQGGHDGAGDWVAYVNYAGTGWVDLGIELVPAAGEIQFSINGEAIHTATGGASVWGADGLNATKIDTVIVQSRNDDSGENTTYLYDDITLRGDTSGRDVYGEGWSLDFSDGRWVVSNADESRSVVLDGVEKIQVDGVVYVLVDQVGGGYASIQAAIDAAGHGETVLIAPGTYEEQLSLGKFVHLVGLGEAGSEGGVLVTGGGTGSGLAIRAGASGTEAAELLVSNLAFSGFNYGLNLQNVSYLTLHQVTASGNGVGVKVPSTASVDHLNVLGSHFDANNIGWYADLNASSASNISHVLIQDTTFSDNLQKGFYTEKLSDALFQSVTVSASGTDASFQYNAGFDINLKYGDYANIVIKDSSFVGSGLDGTGPGTGLKIAARGYEGDGAYADDPATLDGLVLENVVVSEGGSTGLALVNVSNVTSEGNSIDGGLWIEGTGASEAIVGSPANDVLSGGAGDDVIEGGAGDDLIAGGAGIDTAVFSGNMSDYELSVDRLTGVLTIVDTRTESPDGTDLLDGVEQLQFADVTVDVATLNVPATLIVDASGNGDFTSLQAAIEAALAGDTIVVKAGVYEGGVTIDKSVTILGEQGAILRGSFLSGNGIEPGTNVDEWLQTATSYSGASGAGILIGASDVTISGLQIESFLNGVQFGAGPQTLSGIVLDQLDISNVVNGIANTFGEGSTHTSRVDGVDITGVSISHAYQGLLIQDPHNRGGVFNDLTLSGLHFEDILAKGIYAEVLSNSRLLDIEMVRVGQFGRAAPFGTPAGQFGNGIDLNLKWGEYSGIVIDGFEFIDVGLSSGGGSPHAGGGAIVIKAREDGGTYGADPASYSGELIVRNGTIDGTSTGIRVGEPGVVGESGVDVRVEDVTVTDYLTSDDFGAFDNRTDESLTVVGGTGTIETGAASRNVIIEGSEGDDELSGGQGDDTLVGGAGNDTLDGGDGSDTVVFTGNRADYTVTYDRENDVYTIVDNREGAPDGTDTFTGIEFVQFADGTVEAAELRDPVTLIVDASGNGDFTSLQAAIDAALDGDTILVRAGEYLELAAYGGKEGAIGLVIDKSVTIIGVDEGDQPITDWQNVAATIRSGVEASFGANFLVTAQNVTIQGLRFEAVARSNDPTLPENAINKAIEVYAGGFTLEHSVVTAAEGYNFNGVTSTAVYLGDEQVNDPQSVDDLESFRIHGNKLDGGITITNGSGDSGETSFVITDNVVAGTHFLRVRGAVDNIAWLNEHAGLPDTVTGNDLTAVTGFILQNWDQDTSWLADAAFLRDLLEANIAGQYAYVVDADGNVRTVDYSEYTGTAPAVIVERDPADALGAAQAGDTLIVHGNGEAAGEITVAVDDLTIDVSNTSGLGVTLAEDVANVSLIGDGTVDVVGNALDNTFNGNDGDNRFDGGDGIDTVILEGAREEYSVTFNLADGSYTVTGPEGTDQLFGVEFIRFGGVEGENVPIASLRDPITVTVGEDGDFATVAEALAVCGDGDTIVLAAGQHAGGFTVTAGVTIVGEPGAAIVGTGSGVGIAIAASNVTIKGVEIEGFNVGVGFAPTGQTLTGLTLEGLKISDTKTGIAGLNASGGVNKSAASVDGLDIFDVEISGGNMGISLDVDPTAGVIFSHVTIDGVSFSNLDTKGIYLEALSDSVIRDITMTNVGRNAKDVPGNGIDINFKYGTYSNVIIEDFVFNEVGGTSRAGDAAISIKSRDDGNYASNKGVFLGEVIVRNGIIDGTSTGVQVGEPGVNNAGPDVAVENVRVSNHLTTDGFGAFNNLAGGTLSITGSGSVIDTGADSGNVEVVGTAGSDTLTATRGDDVLLGGAGNDSLDGGQGDDVLFGGAGNDLLVGGAGDDTLHGEAGTDVLRGGDGNDTLYGGVGNDSLEGGAGNDTLYGEAGDDILDGGQGDDILSGDQGSDVLRGGAGDDSLIGGAGNDTIDGGAGVDTAHFSGELSEYIIEFRGASVIVTHKDGGIDGVDTLTNVEKLQFASETLDLTAGIRVFDENNHLQGLFDDLQDALAFAQDGYVIELRAGEYELDLNGDLGGSIAHSIRLRGPNAGVAGNATRAEEAVINIVGGSLEIAATGVTIEGVELRGSLTTSSTADGFTLLNSIIAGGEGTAVILDGADNVEIKGNKITGETGVYAYSFGALTIGANYFTSISTAGVVLEPGAAVENATITGNTFHGGQYGVQLDGDPSGYTAESAIVISGNTFLEQQTGIYASAVMPAALDGSLGLSLPLNQYGTIQGNGATPGNGPATNVNVTIESDNDDLLVGGAGDDTIDGTAGNDIIRGGGGDDTLIGGAGNDIIYGGAGNDVAVFSGSYEDYRNSITRDSDGAIVVTGPNGVDRLYGIERLRFLDDGPGDVAIADLDLEAVAIAVGPEQGIAAVQNALDALLLPGDKVVLGEGDYNGAQGSISVDAAVELSGAQGVSLQLTGDAGRTELTLSGNGSIAVVGSSAGAIVDASEYHGEATITGGDGNDMMFGGSGKQTFVLSQGGGQNLVDGTKGDDNTVKYTSATGSVIVDLHAGDALTADFADEFAGDDGELRSRLDNYVGLAYGLSRHESATDPNSEALLFGIDNVVGGEHDDLLIGSDGDNVFDGYGGDDIIIGKGGNDVVVFAGNAADYEIVRIDSAIDYWNTEIAGMLGTPGFGADGLDPDLPIFRVTYVGEDPDLATSSVVQVETLRFTGDAEDVKDYSIVKIGDKYFLQLADGGATYQVGTSYSGDANYVLGGSGDDRIEGGDGNDTLRGGAGDDVLIGGLGEDDLDGGDGSDTYEIAPEVLNDEGESMGPGIVAGDVIADTGATGIDTIKLTGGGELDLSVATISGIERVQFSGTGNVVTIAASQADGLEFVGGDMNDELIVVFGEDDVAFSVSDIETVRLRGTGSLDASGITDVALTVDTGDASDNLSLTGVSTDVDASAYVGELTVSVGDVESETVTVKTGSGDTSISGTGADDVVSVDATKLAADSTLTLSGASGFEVSKLAADLDASGATGDISVEATGAAGQQITTGSGDDSITGGAGGDRIAGGAGADFLDGGAGSDLLFGGEGDDLLYGGDDGNTDYLIGGAGTDYAIFVGSKDDYDIELTTATVDGEANTSVVKVTNKVTDEFDYVDLSTEWLIFTDDVAGFRADDTAYNDKVDTSGVKSKAVHLLNDLGEDAGSFTSLTEAIQAAQAGYTIMIDDDTDLSEEGVVTVSVDDLTITGNAGVQIEGLQLGTAVVSLKLDGAFSTEIQGNELDNVIVGNDGDNVIYGGAGDDFIDLRGKAGANYVDGGAGDDKILGGLGDDVLMGNAGDDLIVTTGGADIVLGGAGNDDIVIGSSDGKTVIVQGGSGSDRFVIDGFPDAPLDLDAIISDFRRGQDVLDFSHLQSASGEDLTRGDLGLASSSDAQIDLSGFSSVAGDVSGSLTLSMINGLRLTDSDFAFDSTQAFNWQNLVLP